MKQAPYFFHTKKNTLRTKLLVTWAIKLRLSGQCNFTKQHNTGVWSEINKMQHKRQIMLATSTRPTVTAILYVAK